jgi:hypothetical protein
MGRVGRFLPPFTGEVARTKCATMGARDVPKNVRDQITSNDQVCNDATMTGFSL